MPDDDEIPQELLLGKQQLSELGSDSAKIKAMGISNKVRRTCSCSVKLLHSWRQHFVISHCHFVTYCTVKVTNYFFLQFSSSKLVKFLNILERNIQDSVKLSTLMNHVSSQPDLSYAVQAQNVKFISFFKKLNHRKMTPWMRSGCGATSSWSG